MMKSLTTQQLKGLTAAVMSLLLMAFVAVPAQAQMDDGELPKVDMSANFAQIGQYVSLDNQDDSRTGLDQVRVGVNASVQFSENVDALFTLETEPSDFGSNDFSLKVDYAILNLAINDQLTFRTGTIVTGLVNFRGLSDGPAVQGNSLISNSVADMITAGQGVKLIGSYDTFGFDLTVNRAFIAEYTDTGNSGVNIIGNARYTGSDLFKVGAGLGIKTGDGVTPNGPENDGPGLIFANGDRDAMNINGGGSTATHANMPSDLIGQIDAQVTPADAKIDLWAGYASQSDFAAYGGDDYSAMFGGLEAMYPVTENLHVAGRFSGAMDQSDGAGDENSLSRIQGGLGYEVYDKAMVKVEGFQQSEGAGTALARAGAGDSFAGVLVELSANF